LIKLSKEWSGKWSCEWNEEWRGNEVANGVEESISLNDVRRATFKPLKQERLSEWWRFRIDEVQIIVSFDSFAAMPDDDAHTAQ
jgi:hypothetical protein